MDEKNKLQKNLIGRISECFIDGLIIVVPPVITAFVVITILEITEGKLKNFLPFYFPGAGLLTIIISIWVVGFIGGNKITQRIIKIFEYFLDQVPVVKFVYSSVKQFSKAIFESDSAFQQVVIVPYHQSFTLGFLMNNVPKPVKDQLGEEFVCVFVPWSLNMTSGTNLFVKKSEIFFVDMEPEDALQFMLTAGTISGKEQKK